MKNDATSSAATVEAFSELSVVGGAAGADPFSRLPDKLIHIILWDLNSAKQAARTTVLSKQWLRAWRSFAVQEYDIAEFMSGIDPANPNQMKAQCSKFIKFVDDTLERTAASGHFILTTVDCMGPQISRWIERAFDNHVEKVVVRILIKADSSDWVTCSLPIRVLSSNCLTFLVLFGPMINLPIDEVPKVDLPCLKFLALKSVIIYDYQLRKILAGCPKLENLSVTECESLSEIVVSNRPNLKSVVVSISTDSANLVLLRIKAPSLEEFTFRSESKLHPGVIVSVNHSPNLKSLNISDKTKSEKWLSEFIAKFPLLEQLTIDDCLSLKRIRISNPLLQLITIQECHYLTDVWIESKKVKCLRVQGCLAYSLVLAEMIIKMDVPPVTSCSAQIRCGYHCWDRIVNSNVFLRLQQFLTRSIQFNHFEFYLAAGRSKPETATIQPLKVFPTRAYPMECLTIGVTAPEASFPFIMTGLLSTIHPMLVNLLVTAEYKVEFVKFFCEELAKKASHNRRCCRGNIKCWKYLLKGVKVKRVLGLECGEGLALHTLIDLVPTIGHQFAIILSFKW